MPNPADIMKFMAYKNKFEGNHPKFVSFIKDVASKGVNEGDIIEITIVKADGRKTTANMKVTADDVAIINELKGNH